MSKFEDDVLVFMIENDIPYYAMAKSAMEDGIVMSNDDDEEFTNFKIHLSGCMTNLGRTDKIEVLREMLEQGYPQNKSMIS